MIAFATGRLGVSASRRMFYEFSVLQAAKANKSNHKEVTGKAAKSKVGTPREAGHPH